jgi:GNAT superfamily N-acetyltransferase
MEIRALSEGDDRSRFRSGDPDLDRFFHRFAGQNQFRHHVGVTYVAAEDRQVLGYATVCPGHLEIDDLPVSARKKLPRYPVPVLRLARLAVDQSARGAGLGSQLLRFVFELGVRMTRDYGCAGIVVDAKPDAISFYARYGFVALEAVAGQSEARPQPVPMFLSMRAIQAALGRRP